MSGESKGSLGLATGDQTRRSAVVVGRDSGILAGVLIDRSNLNIL